MNLSVDYAKANTYGKWCGKWTAKGRSFDGSEVRYHRVSCKSWNCRYCGPRRAKAYQFGIKNAAERHGLSRFLTLTLDPKKLGGDSGKSVQHLRDSFNKFRVYLGRKFGSSIKYIAVVEFQKNGFAHLHLLVDRFIEQTWIKNAWAAVGGGEHVDIRRHKSLNVTAAYLAKYLAKEIGGWDIARNPKEAGEVGVVSGVLHPKKLPKYRRVTCARGITILEKLGRAHRWLLMREPIKWVFMRRRAVARDVEVDCNDVLKCFAVPVEMGRNLKTNSPGYGGWEAIPCVL